MCLDFLANRVRSRSVAFCARPWVSSAVSVGEQLRGRREPEAVLALLRLHLRAVCVSARSRPAVTVLPMMQAEVSFDSRHNNSIDVMFFSEFSVRALASCGCGQHCFVMCFFAQGFSLLRVTLRGHARFAISRRRSLLPANAMSDLSGLSLFCPVCLVPLSLSRSTLTRFLARSLRSALVFLPLFQLCFDDRAGGGRDYRRQGAGGGVSALARRPRRHGGAGGHVHDVRPLHVLHGLRSVPSGVVKPDQDRQVCCTRGGEGARMMNAHL